MDQFPRRGFSLKVDHGPSKSKPCFFSIDEVPHLVDLHDFRVRRHLGIAQCLCLTTDPAIDGYSGDTQEPRDHALRGTACAVQQHGQRLHRRRLAPGRRLSKVAATLLAFVPLKAAHEAGLHETAGIAGLAMNIGHGTPPGRIMARHVSEGKCLHDFDAKPGKSRRCPAREFRPLVSGVSEQFSQEWVKAEQARQDQHPAIAILNIRRMHHGVQQQTFGIHQNMALLAFDFLPGIVSIGIDAAPPFSALFTLWLSMIQAVGLASRPTCSRHSM